MSTALLQVEGLTKYYHELLAVDALSFTVEPGSIVGLLGPNGAGKTTVLRSIAGIVQPTAGRELVLSLSKGMKQKLTIACALVHDPPLLMLDEPIIGIDPRGQREVKALLGEARSAGRGILISTHLLATAEELCDHVLILNRGRAVAEGTLAEVHDRAGSAAGRTLEDLFLDLTAESDDAAAAAT